MSGSRGSTNEKMEMTMTAIRAIDFKRGCIFRKTLLIDNSNYSEPYFVMQIFDQKCKKLHIPHFPERVLFSFICSKSTIETPEECVITVQNNMLRHSVVFINLK